MMRFLCLPLLVLLGLIAPAAGFAQTSAAAPEFFDQQVWPVIRKNCLACHNASTRTSGLSLGSRETMVEGGNRGPAITPGDPAKSVLLHAIEQSGDLKMPPTGKLAPEQVAILRQWIEQGAPWTGSVQLASKTRESSHWAFQPVQPNEPPSVNAKQWVRNPIDQFVLARLEKEGIQPSPEASRTTLIRRLSLDLIGLLPTPEEVKAFVDDKSPDAYEKLVARLLASPHYGERWGRHWLDVARYADSNGYNIDGPREMWKYRDWVIKALNEDKSYRDFVIEQVAGDLLPSPNQDQLIATGYNRNTLLNLEGGIDFEQYRVDAVADRVDNTGQAFLGLTLGCARCHDHKYDPISQREYYQIFAFFDSVDELSGAHGDEKRPTAHEPLLEFGAPEELARRDALREQIRLLDEELKKYEEGLRAKQPEWERSLTAEAKEKIEFDIRQILDVPPDQRNEFQKEGLEREFFSADLGWSERRKGIAAIRALEPHITSTMIMKELPEPRKTHILLGGDFLRKGIEVQPGVLKVLPPLEADGRANRLDFARWLVDEKNPLTPRVTVNRVWQRYFGKGLVDTENDFGTQGSEPTHPELLNWMASEFMRQGWSLKKLHTLIVTSAVYRQSSDYRSDLAERDPYNNLLARQNRLRLEAETVRDAALSASGLLSPTIGGPSVFPPQPAGAGRVTQIDRKWTAVTGPDRYRRGLYTYFWRSAPHPALVVFDAPDSTTSCTRRNRSNTPLQALTLLNDEAYVEFAKGLAQRVLKEAPEDQAGRIQRAFSLSLTRSPKDEEAARFRQFLNKQLDDFQTDPALAKKVTGDQADPRLAAWTAASRVLLNLDEFITRE